MPAYTAHTKSSNIGRMYHWFQLCIVAQEMACHWDIPNFCVRIISDIYNPLYNHFPHLIFNKYSVDAVLSGLSALLFDIPHAVC